MGNKPCCCRGSLTETSLDGEVEPQLVNHAYLATISPQADQIWAEKGFGTSRPSKKKKSKMLEDVDDEKMRIFASQFSSSPGRMQEDVQERQVLELKKRKERKMQTMPVKLDSRRTSITLSKEALTKLLRQQDELKFSAARRHDAFSLVGASLRVVSDSELESTWKEHATCHVHGKLRANQQPMDERDWKFAVRNRIPKGKDVYVSCQKGNKGDKSPNQDNFSLTFFSNGWSLACVFDGHGECGHTVSTRTVQTAPYFLIKSEHFPHDMEKALIEAFKKSHADVVALALQDNWNVMASGATAVAALWKGNQVWTANCGDSRCVVGSMIDASVIHETEDHKLDQDKEHVRITTAGGRIQATTYDDGVTLHRLYIGNEDYPGLAMSRSLGDVCVKEIGVIATPDVVSTQVDMSKKPCIVLSSDGVWEFMSTKDVLQNLKETIDSDGVDEALAGVHGISMELWAEEEGAYCDDISSVLILLSNDAA